jgi:hypothetical protein
MHGSYCTAVAMSYCYLSMPRLPGVEQEGPQVEAVVIRRVALRVVRGREHRGFVPVDSVEGEEDER